MSGFSLTTAKEKTHDLSSLLLSDFMLFCSLILSHPLYFSYFIFFSPYFLKIFSFLSPLFITTALLFLAFLTLTPTFVNHGAACHLENSPESNASFLLTAYQTFVETLRSKVEDYDQSDGFGCLEELEAFKIVFETSTILEIRENPDEVLEMESKGDCFQAVEEAPIAKKCPLGVPENEKPPEITRTETNQVKAVVKIFEEFVVKKENLSSKKRDKEGKSVGVESNKVDERKEDEIMTRGSEAVGNNKISDLQVIIGAENGSEHAAKAVVNDNNYNDQTMGSDPWNLGSMRKQKEWKRTLACKLFEERHSHNVDGGGEGMDLLWETYETDSDSKVELKSGSKKGKKGGGNNNGYYYDNDDYEEEESNVQLCCLQALKFSAGKMNLGMGRPNLVKISKALKGIGWLHRVGSRNGKKGYH
ncbi:hypothetical protein like AT3G25130 [Hibiscus trionum]|uniref:Uncharacterized protein n=1 Tax=Hibiscus trionum TaxID=183268 RepID=A0A9W7JC40_HIBTR|nr:hypothetical protein like AT3G25130 [Hibiscus trionum]